MTTGSFCRRRTDPAGMRWDPHADPHWSPQNPCNLQEYKIKYYNDPDMHLPVRSRRAGSAGRLPDGDPTEKLL